MHVLRMGLRQHDDRIVCMLKYAELTWRINLRATQSPTEDAPAKLDSLRLNVNLVRVSGAIFPRHLNVLIWLLHALLSFQCHGQVVLCE